MTIKKYFKIFVIFTLIILILISIYCFFKDSDNNLEVTFLDIGQGDSIFIKTPFGQNVLIDGGEGGVISKRLSEELSFLDRKIDLMILTHPHSDHVGGLIEILERYNIGKILYTGAIHNSPDYLAWLQLIKNKNISLGIINNPQKIIFGEDCFLDIIYPMSKSDIVEHDNLNNTSIVSKLVFGKTSFLLTGDAEIEVEEELLLSSRDKLKANVLKLGHHGSDTSSSNDFLEAVQPSYAVIQVGENNSFGHPSLRVIKRLERSGVKILRNDLFGSISFRSDGEILKVD